MDIKNLNELQVGDVVLLHRDWTRDGWVTAEVERVTRTQVTVHGDVHRIDAGNPRLAFRHKDVYHSTVQTFDQSVLDKQEEVRNEAARNKVLDDRARYLMMRLGNAVNRYSGLSKAAVLDRIETLVRGIEPSV